MFSRDVPPSSAARTISKLTELLMEKNQAVIKSFSSSSEEDERLLYNIVELLLIGEDEFLRDFNSDSELDNAFWL